MMEDSSIAIAQAIAALECAEEIKTYLRALFNQELLDPSLQLTFYVRQAEELATNWSLPSDVNP